MRHILQSFLTLSAILALTAAPLPAAATPTDEAEFVSLINQSRAAAGLSALTVFADLTDDARIHTADMIGAGRVFHSTNAQLGSYATGWSLLGENVGMGPNPALLHQAFMNSESHRSNILGDYDLVGVGADRSADGVMFVTVVFMRTAAPPTTTTTAPPPTTTTTTPPPTTTTTAPPPTTTTAQSPSTTAAPVVQQTAAEPTQVEPSTLGAATGSRPASKVAGAVNDRTFEAFRPVFSLLSSAGGDPIVRFTSNGTRVIID